MLLHNSSSRNGGKATAIYHNTDNGWFGERKTQTQVFWKAWFVNARVDYSNHQLVSSTDDWLHKKRMEYLLFWLCYKRNGKRCSFATLELCMHLGGFLGSQEAVVTLGYASINSYASFVPSNLLRASVTRWLHVARCTLHVYHFLSCIYWFLLCIVCLFVCFLFHQASIKLNPFQCI